MKTLNSEYIRRDYENKQEVTTDLDFKGALTCKEATKDNEPIVLSQLNDIKNEVIEEVKNLPNVAKTEKLQLIFNGISGRTTAGAYMASLNAYQGLGGITFMDNRGYPLEVVGWSFGEGYNAITTYNNYLACTTGVKQVYFSPQVNENFVSWTNANTRMCKYPLSDEDKEFFNNLGRPVICMNIDYSNAMCCASNSNFAVWNTPLSAFRSYCFNLVGGSSSVNNGFLMGASSVPSFTYKIWIDPDDLNSLDNFLTNVKALCFGNVAYAGASYKYGGQRFNFQMIKNQTMLIDIDCSPDIFKATFNGDKYAYVNITKEEANNNAEWDAEFLKTYPTYAKGGHLQLGANAGRIKYNATTDSYYWEDA